MAFTAKIADIIADDKTGLLSKHESWERITLSDVVEILNGAPFDSAHFNPTTGTALARIRDVLAGESTTYYSGAYEEIHVLKQGDLLVGMDGDFHTGFWGTQPALLNQRVCKLTPDEAFYDKALLGYVLPGYLAAINAHTPSITVKHLSSKTIGEIELPLPPRAEQTHIVEKLESLLADLDAGVAELKAAQRKLAQYRQSLLKAAVEGALTADWRAAHTREESGEHLLHRILQERRARFEQKHGGKKKYLEPVAPDVSQLPELPDGWVWASVEQLAELVSGHTPKDAGQFAADDGEVHWFKVGDMNTEGNEQILVAASTRFSKETADELGLKVMPVGTIVFPKRGGAIATNKKRRLGVAGAYDLNMMGLAPVSIAADWLWSWFTGIDLAKLADGSNVPQINNPDIAPLCVPLPPLEEQHAILAHLETALAACKQQEHAIAHGLKLAAAQRKNLLRAAFAGQLVPQDPSDEPASALLARIRAARDDAPATPRGRSRKKERS